MSEPDWARIDALIDAGDLAGARAALATTAASDPHFTVLRIKLSLVDGTLQPGAAMQELIALMRRDDSLPGAKALYQEASRRAYANRQSTVAHSHPPPPSAPRDDED